MEGDPTTSPEGPAQRPRAIGPFRLEDEIGRGGMGVVYRAVGPGGEPAAVKVVRASVGGAEARLRFEREAMIRIEHPNVVRVLGAGADEAHASLYLALELLSGESLEQRLLRGALGLREVVALGTQACAGLAAAHRVGVVHRDLKPSNLFLCDDGTVKVLDFGVALLLDDNTRLTTAGGALGTPAYMAPEQVRGELALDARVDVWALGAVLYEALTGKAPFYRDTILATMFAIHMEEPAPLWAAVTGSPPALDAAIEKALAKPAALRWASIDELGDALRAVPLGAEAPAPLPALRPPRAELELGDTVALPLMPLVSTAAGLSSLIPAGEHRIVAVLLAEGVLDFAPISEAVRGLGGSLLPLLGKRALGLFGAETWEGDELRRAASAALGARRFAERVAVASGRATSSGGGISGDVLRSAELGCNLALVGVAVDAPSARSLEAEFSVRPVGPLVSEIVGRRTTDSAVSRPLVVEPPLLGRDAELAQLRAGLQRMLSEQQHTVLLVSGPPGIGKSRLRRALEVELEAQEERVTMLSARAEPLRREAALSLFAAVVRGCLHLATAPPSVARLNQDPPAQPTARAIQRLAAESIPDAAAAHECALFLGELLAVPVADTPAVLAARADPQLMADRLRLALLDLFEGMAQQGPLALVLEDLQWADRPSLTFLEDLLDRLADAPLLVFATTRPELLEAQPALFAGRNVVRVEPPGLTSADVATLAQRVAGRSLPEALIRAIVDRTAGHPLFVEQIVLELRDSEQLDVVNDGAVLPMTLTVEAAVQSRLDHLPPAEKDACKRASVFGRPFATEELEAMGVPGAAAVLGSLGRRDLVAGRAKAGGGRGRQFQFRSTLVADVAYGMIADESRRELHRRAARYLGGKAQADDEEIGRHHDRGGDPVPAAERYAAAALAAALRGDIETVLRCSKRALDLGAPPALRFALRMARADALRGPGRSDEQGVELALARGFVASDVELGRVLTEQAVWMSRTGQSASALATAEAAVEAAERAGDADVLTAARARHMGALIFAGEFQQARAAFGAATRSAGGATPQTRALLASAHAHLAGALGDLGERSDAYAAAVALYREAGDIRRAAGAETNLADVYNRVGAYAEAEVALRQALEGCRRVNNRTVEGYALVNLSYALLMQDKRSEALERAREALAIATATREVRLALWARIYLARIRLALGDVEEARGEAEQAALEAERVGYRGTSVAGWTVAASAQLRVGEREGALASSARAIAMLDELGGVEEYESELFVIHAQSLEALGRDAESARVRARGRARVEEVAARISDPQMRERFFRAVAANRELMTG